MQQYLDLGSAPYEEDCAQVGSDDYFPRMRKESNAYIKQLRRQFGPEPEGAKLAIKSFPHDFGTYHEVVCYFDDDNEIAAAYAICCESELPGEWDSEARKELNQ